MADAQPGITTGYTLGAVTPTAILSNTKGSPHRRMIIISNLDAAIVVFYAFGTGNKASASVGHPLAAGATVTFGGPAQSADGNSYLPCPPGDLSMIGASGTPNVAVTILS